MKINKKLSTAIVLSLMLGVYGTASADDIYAIDGGITNSRSVAAPSNNQLKLNVLPDWANSSSSVYGGYASSTKGNSTNNNGTINGVTVGMFYGGYAEKGVAKSNIANVLGGTVSGNVYGGWNGDGSVQSNQVSIFGGKIGYDASGDLILNKGNIFGGYTKNGLAQGNTVTISQAEGKTTQICGNVYGGYIEEYGTGDANNNIVNVSGGEMSAVGGGYTLNGSAVGNHVNVTGGKMLWVDGGFSGLYGKATEALYVSSNIVEISGAATEVAYHVSGGSIQNGNALNNEAIVTGGTIGADVHGGEVTHQGDATGNTVSINGAGPGTTERVQITGNVYGGQTDDGAANNNKVGTSATNAATNFTANKIYGGKGTTGATGNKVWLGEGAIVSEVYGGDGATGAADNEVWLGAGAEAINVLGGNSDGNSKSNTVTIETGGLVYMVFGGQSRSGDAIKNSVIVKGTVDTDVYGGSTAKGAATGNEVTISGGTIGTAGHSDTGFVYGGHTKNGDAASNEVTINNANVTGEVYGGYVNNYYETCNVANNKVNITSGTIGSKVYGAKTAKGESTENEVVVADSSISGGVYGGYSDDDSTSESNTVTISNSSVSGEIRGGNSFSGIAKSNQVSITGGTVGGFDASGNPTSSFSYVYGNYSESGSAIGGGVTNVTITDSKINGLVFGGYHYKTKSEGLTVEVNKVEISDSNVSRTVYGGLAMGGDAQGNQVSISQTKENATEMGNGVYGNYAENGSAIGGEVTNVTVNGGTIRGDVTGGWGKTGATGNSVSITGGKLTEKVYGGQSTEGNAQSNEVTISSGEVGKTVYGGYTANGAANSNKVTISAGTINKDVTGGVSKNGNATNNIVNITGGSIEGTVTGGSAADYDDTAFQWSGKGDATGNAVTVADATIGKDGKGGVVYGGYALNGAASNNSVTIESGTIGSIVDFGMFSESTGVVGGYAENGDSTNNTVTINGGTIGADIPENTGGIALGSISGGESFNGNATGNSLIINGGTIKKAASGGRSWDGKAESNVLTVAGGTINSDIYGGQSTDRNADSNTVNITSGTVNKGIYGGYSFHETANNNIVNISGDADTSAADIYGGKGTSAGSGNTLNIDTWNGTKTMKSISDFQAINVVDTQEINVGDADGLEDGKVVLDINDSTVDLKALANDAKIVYLTSTGSDDFSAKFSSAKFNGYKPNEGIWRSTDKGFGIEGSDAEFQIDEKEAFVSVKEVVLAGYFTGNTGATQYNSAVINDEGGFVLTSGVEAYEKIYGSFDATGICSAGDKVFIESALDMSKSTIYGNNDKADGNVLKVKANGVKVKGIENFENINFYIPADAAAGDKMLTVGTDIDLTNINVAAGFHNDTTLGYGDKVILIDAPSVTGLDGVSEVKVDDTDFTTYDVMVYQGDASMEQVESGATTLVAEMANTELKENSKILAETIIAGATVVNDGSDMLAGAGFDSAASAIAADMETGALSGKMSMFGAISGNKSKVHTGSHVDVKGWNMNLGFAKELKNKDGKMIIGPVVEYGRGDYDSYLDNGYHGEGNSHYVGGGVMAKQINNNGNYFEGSLRAGKLTNEFKSTGGSYDSDVTYLAGHLGLGHVQKMDAKNSMDYYAKYFHTHTDGDDIKVNAKNKDLDMNADSMTSARLRIGTRLNHKMSAKSSYYIGFAWQREFSGIANAALAGKEIAAPSMKGNSGFMELGVKLFDSSRYDLDLGGFGSVGKKEGAGFNFNFNFKF